jgi:acetyl esterase/lipase
MGDSSGGNLVHEVGLRAQATPPDLLHPVCVRGGISIHPGYVRSERSQSEMENPPDSAFLTLDMIDKFLKLSAPDGITTRDHPITNPMRPDAPPLKYLKFPHMLVAIADRDLLRDTYIEYCEAMKNVGHNVEVFISENVDHSFYLDEITIKYDLNTTQETSKLLQAADRFIKSCF